MKAKPASGFTLVEVVVASLLLTTVGALLFVAFTSANRWVQPQNSSAFGLARQTLEGLYIYVRQNNPFGQPYWNATGTPLSAGFDNSASPESIVLDNTTYQRSYKVTTVSPAGGTPKDYRKVEIKVSWPSS
jgi:Tfp pilus assembly protein PilV